MYRNRRQSYHQLVQFIEEIERTFLHASNIFDCLRQEANAHTSINPENFTACDFRVRELYSNTLIKRLQEHRKLTEQLKELCVETLCEVKKYNPPTLLIRTEMFIRWKIKEIDNLSDKKWKIRELLDRLLYVESQVVQYQIKLLFRQVEFKIAKLE
ncbi:hypothetical protein CEXT_279711 [Caerostris extrusa]|uniref:Uncharacterized protein n=1 Tax=Caerostris extrusa TaxID=172846 RepID=A0AAV4XQC3_CAEEX|nr:hypothetical protein CEXT_279711 [Caerostris extrusa]